jgi:Uma2 family endonuclease
MSALPIKKWSREEFSRLIATDLLDADRRYELIEGLVLELMTHNPPHVTAVALVDGWLRSIVPDCYFVRSQSPIALDDHSEPEPDAAVVRGRIQDYARRHPEPSEIELVVEVSDSSLERDRKVKAPLYARVGIRELWIIDLVDRKLELHRDPGPDGYRVVTILAETGAAAPIFAPVDAVNVSALLPS